MKADPEDVVVIGRVINPGKRLVVGARLQLWLQGDDDRAVGAVTEADGTFRLVVKAAGACNFVAFDPGFGFVRRESLAVAIRTLDVGDLVLQPRPSASGYQPWCGGRAG